MAYAPSFGTLAAQSPAVPGSAFRLALMGDFSARASRGKVQTGADLAARHPLVVDIDKLDGVMARLAPSILIPLSDEDTVAVGIGSLDDFHPNQLAAKLPLFDQLVMLRRVLQSRAGFDRVAKQVLSWAGAEPLLQPRTRRSRGRAIATDRKLSELARLSGRQVPAETDPGDVIRRLIGSTLMPARDTRQDALVARVDAAMSDAMRRVLHYPEFQSTEALWRGVDRLVRRLATGARLQIVLYDVSAEEFAADLAATDALEQTGLHALLSKPTSSAQAGPISLIAGLYDFELSPPHADLLGRMAQIAAAAGAPFVTSIEASSMQVPRDQWHGLVEQAWSALQAHPAAAFLGLATPRFLLRLPYGERTDPIEAFAFEEFTPQSGLSGMLWGNPALLVAELAATSWQKDGPAMRLGSTNMASGLPTYVYGDGAGTQVALPCTERLLTEPHATRLADLGVIPVVSIPGRPKVRLASFGAMSGAATLAGRWSPPQPVPRIAAASPPAGMATASDLDALLATIGTDTGPAAEGEMEAGLRALLASVR